MLLKKHQYILVCTHPGVYTWYKLKGAVRMDTTTNKKILGTFTVGKVGNSLKVTIPAGAGIKNGSKVIASITDNGELVYTTEKKHVNIWHTDFVKSDEFKRDKEIIGELQGTPVGKERISE
jgi:hypothetical protein